MHVPAMPVELVMPGQADTPLGGTPNSSASSPSTPGRADGLDADISSDCARAVLAIVVDDPTEQEVAAAAALIRAALESHGY